MNTDHIILHCDVMLAPGTVIRKGCTMTTLIKALNARATAVGLPSTFDKHALKKAVAIIEPNMPVSRGRG